jgi:acetoacetate decarboxylase
MGRVRYAKSLRDLERNREVGGEFLESTVRSIRCVYETDAEVTQAVVPRPLEATTDPHVQIVFSQVAMHVSPERTLEFAAAHVGVSVHYDGRDALYPLTMPVTSEGLVMTGRERFGEPRKLARIAFDVDAECVSARVERLEGALDLVDSPYDPIADLPVRRVVSLEYTEGRSLASGRVLRPVPGDWLLPFLHQRNDDPTVEGIDV